MANAEEIRRIRRELVSLKKKIYGNLTPWQTVQVSRHKNRPQMMDYVDLIFEDFVELHGDRAIGDDRAIRCGFARLGDFRVRADRPPEGPYAQGKAGVLLWLRPPRGLPQGAEEHAAGGEVPAAGGLPDRHAGRLPRHRRRGARPGPAHRGESAWRCRGWRRRWCAW